jgi:hypothetical protein
LALKRSSLLLLRDQVITPEPDLKPAAAEIVPEDQDSPIICLSPVFWRQIKEPRGEVGFAFYAGER